MPKINTKHIPLKLSTNYWIQIQITKLTFSVAQKCSGFNFGPVFSQHYGNYSVVSITLYWVCLRCLVGKTMSSAVFNRYGSLYGCCIILPNFEYKLGFEYEIKLLDQWYRSLMCFASAIGIFSDKVTRYCNALWWYSSFSITPILCCNYFF